MHPASSPRVPPSGRNAADRALLRPIDPGQPGSSSGGRPCSCGHAKKAHEHYRGGTDCALCGCARFRRRSLIFRRRRG